MIPLRFVAPGNISALDLLTLVSQEPVIQWLQISFQLNEAVIVLLFTKLSLLPLEPSQLRQVSFVHRTVLQIDFSAAWEGS